MWRAAAWRVHICICVQAQELFLRSSIPRAALEMRMDLKDWADALKLAEQHAPDHIAAICKEHAASLEMTGELMRARERACAYARRDAWPGCHGAGRGGASVEGTVLGGAAWSGAGQGPVYPCPSPPA